MADEVKVGCLFCDFKTKTNESLQQHMNNKHKPQASSYAEAMQMMGSPAMEVMVKTLHNLKKEKEEKEQMVVKLEKNLQAANDHLEMVKKELEQKSKALENAEQEIIRKDKEEQAKALEISMASEPGLEIEPTNTEIPNKIESPQKANDGSDINDISNKICKYFNSKKGCRRGESCHFKHGTKDKDDCKFWMKGKCKFSDDICWNRHDHGKRGTKEMKVLTNKNANESEGRHQESESQTNLINMLTQLLVRFVLQSSAMGQ